jgi:alkanesulfonate monooxygenase SsuD/methylene tetrahydromethanopterin reductase-like flavin-dependent oxidoreductase (luciferase family)
MVMQNAHDQLSDREAYERDLHIAQLIEPLGFDRISSVEHHFDNYSMSPDNISLLSWLAGKTTKLKLLTGAVILPWNVPVRVVERMILLDHLSGGRAQFGLGRGLAKREYEAFGLDMNEARPRFDEAARMVVKGVETGIVEGEGPFYKQQRVQVRPGPYASFKDRLFCVAMSTDSVPICAELGAKMMIFAQGKSWTDMLPHFDLYKSEYRKHHNTLPPTPTITEFMFCDESADRAEEMAYRYIGGYYGTVLKHYEFAEAPHAGVTGYEFYTHITKYIERHGKAGAAEDFVKLMPYGTPAQVLEKIEVIKDKIGMAGFFPNFVYAGMNYAEGRRNMNLFADKVMPELKSWNAPPVGLTRARAS